MDRPAPGTVIFNRSAGIVRQVGARQIAVRFDDIDAVRPSDENIMLSSGRMPGCKLAGASGPHRVCPTVRVSLLSPDLAPPMRWALLSPWQGQGDIVSGTGSERLVRRALLRARLGLDELVLER